MAEESSRIRKLRDNDAETTGSHGGSLGNFSRAQLFTTDQSDTSNDSHAAGLRPAESQVRVLSRDL